jgi:molybdopterin/thiamine biosynthesis adenylyltransferase
MNSIITNRKREPQIIFPAQIPEEKYVGELKGYYVENTNSYNVLPFDGTAGINENKTYPIGFILPANPFHFVDKEIASLIQYLKIEESAPDEIVGKMHRILQSSGDISHKYFNKEHLHAETAGLISKFRPAMMRAMALNRYVGDLADDAQPLPGDAFCAHAVSWMENVFVNLLYLHPGDTKNNSDSHAVAGYWENGELHFVQLTSRKECRQEKYSLKLDVFSRNAGILESDIMLGKGAVFIGCGSVGSLFALELAKAGVGHFLLIDNDIFGYHNICRHQCGIYDVGRYKTDALAERILQVNPYAKVVTRNRIVQDVPVAELLEFCDKNTIVIGGADNRDGDLYANNIARQIGMPFMSVGCWERAFAGEIFYCLPRTMPDYQDFMEVSGLLSARVSQNRRFYTTEEELEKVSFEPGISADINFVTIIAVKIALDILNVDNENYTQRLLPHLTQYTLVCNTNDRRIGGETAEIFSYPLQVTTSIIVPYSKKQHCGDV